MKCDTCGREDIHQDVAGMSKVDDKNYCYMCTSVRRKKEESIIPFEWETIHGDLFRSKVFGGWLIKQISKVSEYKTYQLCFIPDNKHEWKISEEDTLYN